MAKNVGMKKALLLTFQARQQRFFFNPQLTACGALNVITGMFHILSKAAESAAARTKQKREGRGSEKDEKASG